jgi:low affinity Fe/Cu permease
MAVLRRFTFALARAAPGWIGAPTTFAALLLATAVWLALGPFVGFSDAWLLIPSAVASIVALLLVALLQHSQNRDTRALQLKLDELLRAMQDARGHLVRVERLSDEELEQIEREFDDIRDAFDDD